MATLLVKCYPAVPDALGIASALASELGEPDSPSARQLALQLGGYLGEGAGRVERVGWGAERGTLLVALAVLPSWRHAR